MICMPHIYVIMYSLIINENFYVMNFYCNGTIYITVGDHNQFMYATPFVFSAWFLKIMWYLLQVYYYYYNSTTPTTLLYSYYIILHPPPPISLQFILDNKHQF
jgi:hypothetical protein